MNESAGKCRKRYVYHPKDIYKLTCIINRPGNKPDKFKVLGDFGFKYSKIRPTKDRGQEPAKTKIFNRNQENNAIVQHAVDDTILKENTQLSVE